MLQSNKNASIFHIALRLYHVCSFLAHKYPVLCEVENERMKSKTWTDKKKERGQVGSWNTKKSIQSNFVTGPNLALAANQRPNNMQNKNKALSVDDAV